MSDIELNLTDLSKKTAVQKITKTKDEFRGNLLLDRGVNIVNVIALPLIVVLVWQIVSTSGIFNPILMPSLGTIGKSFVKSLQTGQLAEDMQVSLIRVLRGFFYAVVLGIVFGIIMGIFSRIDKFFSAVFNAIRQIPSLAWVPLLILWFGIGETSKLILIIKAAFFPVLLNTIEGIRCLPASYLELSRLYRINRKDQILKMYIPSALPFIFTGLRLAAGSAWIAVVASEIIVATSGLGHRINDARNFMRSDIVIVNMIVIGVIGVVMDFLLKQLEKYLPFGKYQRV
ncbi:MAG: ABC transporter permease [Treponema sp.]|jgi:sulfonate transport system permease protein|nr:ABC transporter permease [Treponema sp.]